MSKSQTSTDSESLLTSALSESASPALAAPASAAPPAPFTDTSLRDWDAIRNYYVIGEKVLSEQGTWITKDISLAEVAKHFKVPYDTVVLRSRRSNWKLLREKYKDTLSKNKLGKQLSIYAQETFTNEVSALNAVTRLSKVAELYIEYKYQKLLDLANNPDLSVTDLDEETIEALETVNKNTGIPIFLDGVARAAKIVENLYKLQRSIYDNAPDFTPDDNNVDVLTEAAKKAKLAQLERELNVSFSMDL
jgi:hypothetical protein